MAAPLDPYATLGVARDAPDAKIRSAYRKLARKHHPDVNPGNQEAEEQFKRISAAYEILSDPQRRKLYDEFGEEGLRGGFDPDKARAYRQWASGRQTTRQPFAAEAEEFDLGDLFGGFGAAPVGRAGRRVGPAAGADVHAVAEIDLIDAIRGIELSVAVPSQEPCPTCGGSGDQPGTTARTCPTCGGSGREQVVRGPLRLMSSCRTCGGEGRLRTPCTACGGSGARITESPVKVRIPPGADTGDRLRVAGRGMPGARGGPAGDLIIETRVKPHPWFRRAGLDLHLDLPVTLAEAYEGDSVEVPTPDGPVKLRIPPRSQSGTQLRLRGKGVPRAGRRGDLHAHLVVKLPDGDDPRFAEAARAAAPAYTHPVREGIRL